MKSSKISDAGIYHFNQPTAFNRYRDSTDRQKACAGVTLPTFRCQCCKKTKPAAGRKQVVKGSPKYGYVCAECASA